jgi:anthranilate phosphoribosyltransferase
MPITPQQALQRCIEHREIFHDEMVELMHAIMRGEIADSMLAAILTGLRVKRGVDRRDQCGGAGDARAFGQGRGC